MRQPTKSTLWLRSAPAKPSSKPFRFLGLPAEICNMIYGLSYDCEVISRPVGSNFGRYHGLKDWVHLWKAQCVSHDDELPEGMLVFSLNASLPSRNFVERFA